MRPVVMQPQVLHGPCRLVTVWVTALDGCLPLVVLQRYFPRAEALHWRGYCGELLAVTKIRTRFGEVIFYLPNPNVRYLVSLEERTYMPRGFLSLNREMNHLKKKMNLGVKKIDDMDMAAVPPQTKVPIIHRSYSSLSS
jgi:hypothetical protein